MKRVAIYLLSYSAIMLPSYVILFFGFDYQIKYNSGVSYLHVAAFQILVMLFFIFFASCRMTKKQTICSTARFKLNNISRIRKVKYIIVFERPLLYLYFVLSLIIISSGLNDYRHVSSFLTNSFVIFPFETIKFIIYGIFVIKVCDPIARPYLIQRTSNIVLFFVATILGSTGSYMVVQAIIVCSIVYINFNKISNWKFVLLFMLSIVSLFVAVFVGFANKFNFNLDTMYYMFTVDTSYVMNYLAWRPATFLNSTSYWLANTFNYDILNIVSSETNYRFSKIFGGDAPLTEPRSFSRVNYLNIFVVNTHPVSGTSAGLFGGLAAFINNQPIPLFISLLLCLIMIRLFAFYPRPQSGVWPIVLISTITYQYFDSVVDMLIVPSPSTISLLVFIVIIYFPRLKF